jgi:large subunit ribosomal protein L24
MAALKIRSGDDVIVISGKDRGKTGKVLRVDPKKSRVYVEGLNIIKRHQRPTQSTDPAKAAGGVVEKEAPIHISNVQLIDPKTKKPTRVGVSRDGGTRNRVSKRSGEKLD